MKILLLLLLIVCFSFQENIYTVIAYCPDEFSGAGAVVKVDSETGEYSIENTFKWPDLFGCIALYDPTITYDRERNRLFLDFMDDFGLELILDTKKGKIEKEVKPKDPFMIGFDNMAYDHKIDELVGLVPTGEKEGEWQYMRMKIEDGKVWEEKDVEFKALMDDSHYLDTDKKVYYVQASYDQRDVPHCAPHDSDLCMLKLDSSTGELLKATYTNWTIYKYNRHVNPDGTILAFVDGFPEYCKHPYNEYLFATIDLEKATVVEKGPCIQHNVTIQMDEWIGSFNKDGSLFTTASRFAQTTQFLVFDTQTGKVHMDTALPGLSEKLGAYARLYWIWDVSFEV